MGREEDGSGFGEDWEVDEGLEDSVLIENDGIGVVPAAALLDID